MKKLPEIPNTYIIAFIFLGCIILRAFGIDTWTTAALSLLTGYVTGKHVEQTRKCP